MNALVVGAILTNNYAWWPSIVQSVVLNCLGRFAWVRFLISRALMKFGFTRVARELRPSVATKIHDEVKYTFGYPRFMMLISLSILRFVRGEEFILFNTPAAWCVLFCFVGEVIEDLVMHFELLPYAPAPPAAAFAHLANVDPLQLYAHGCKETNRLSEGSDNSQTFSTKFSERINFKVPLRRALTLHGVRECGFWEHGIAYTAAMIFPIFVLQFLLGAGFVLGHCAQPLGGVGSARGAQLINEAFFWQIPMVCSYE